MSIAVELSDLQAKSAEFRWAYLVTVRDDLTAHVVAVSPSWVDGAIVMSVGKGSARNATARSAVTLCYPPVDPIGFSLIVDGAASVDADDLVTLQPTAAVLHRPAS